MHVVFYSPLPPPPPAGPRAIASGTPVPVHELLCEAVIPSAANGWTKHPALPGIAMKTLAEDGAGGSSTLFHVAPNTPIPGHQHDVGGEHTLVLRGSLSDGHTTIRAGEVVNRPEGTEDLPSKAGPEGAVVLVQRRKPKPLVSASEAALQATLDRIATEFKAERLWPGHTGRARLHLPTAFRAAYAKLRPLDQAVLDTLGWQSGSRLADELQTALRHLQLADKRGETPGLVTAGDVMTLAGRPRRSISPTAFALFKSASAPL